MADFFMENIKQSFSLSDIDSNMEIMNNFPEMNPSYPDTSMFSLQSLMGFPGDNIFPHLVLPECSGISQNFPGSFVQEEKNLVLHPVDDHHAGKKRKVIDTRESSGANSSAQGSANGATRRNSAGKGKKAKGNEEEKPKDVVHVRAKRGQATDSHSLAERVRRGKINERLRCLQDIIPGCSKTMGMAVMLDEIINYVHSLQSQVEFLSMKLTAASTFYDFNSETDAFETMQQAKAYEALKMQKNMAKESCEGIGTSQFGPLDSSFGNYPSWPRNT